MINIRDVHTEDEVRALSLGDRMKWYEKNVGKVLSEGYPAIIRIDGKAFHTYTNGFEKPFDEHISGAMLYTTIKLCEEIQNVKIAYMQSDEISLLMTTHQNPEAEHWFKGKVDKIVSVSASMASAHFNHYMDKMYWNPRILAAEVVGDAPKRKLAVFDARAWSIPFDEVNNVFVWRQQDAIRNSVSALAQSEFSHKELNKKNVETMKQMLAEKGILWHELPEVLQRGHIVEREYYEKDGATRSHWVSSQTIPIFSVDRSKVSKFVEVTAT